MTLAELMAEAFRLSSKIDEGVRHLNGCAIDSANAEHFRTSVRYNGVAGRCANSPGLGHPRLDGGNVTYRTCAIDGCDAKHSAKGWCNKHYKRFLAHGSAEYVPEGGGTCSFGECDRPVHTRNPPYCAKHYTRYKRHGDPGHLIRPTGEWEERDGYALIPLRNRDGGTVAHTMVDVIDAWWLTKWRWSRNQSGYAYRVDGNRTVLLARLLLGLVDAGPLVESDHINRDRLDNRRANLRVVTPAENCANRGGVFGGGA